MVDKLHAPRADVWMTRFHVNIGISKILYDSIVVLHFHFKPKRSIFGEEMDLFPPFYGSFPPFSFSFPLQFLLQSSGTFHHNIIIKTIHHDHDGHNHPCPSCPRSILPLQPPRGPHHPSILGCRRRLYQPCLHRQSQVHCQAHLTQCHLIVHGYFWIGH